MSLHVSACLCLSLPVSACLCLSLLVSACLCLSLLVSATTNMLSLLSQLNLFWVHGPSQHQLFCLQGTPTRTPSSALDCTFNTLLRSYSWAVAMYQDGFKRYTYRPPRICRQCSLAAGVWFTCVQAVRGSPNCRCMFRLRPGPPPPTWPQVSTVYRVEWDWSQKLWA